MVDAQGNQDVRVQVGVHVGMEVGPELVILGDIGLDQGVPGPEAVVLGLAHEGLGDGGDGRLPLDGPIRINVGHLGVPEPQDIDGPVAVVDVAGNLSPDHLEAVPVKREGQAAEPGQVGDEVAGRVVGRAEHIVQGVAVDQKLHNDILFLVQVELSEWMHFSPPRAGDGYVHYIINSCSGQGVVRQKCFLR